MPTQYSVSRSIAAPADSVWRLLTDSSSYADWNPAVVRIEGPITTGGTIRLVSIASPKRTFSIRVTTMEAPHRMIWSDGMPLGLFKGVRTYLLEPEGQGTRFSMTELFTGPLAGMITKSIPDLTGSFNQFADGLKRAAEQLTA